MYNIAFLMTLRRKEIDVPPLGFRSTFRDWASERTNFARDVCEMAVAHTVSDKTEAAYWRGDRLDKRRKLMATWHPSPRRNRRMSLPSVGSEQSIIQVPALLPPPLLFADAGDLVSAFLHKSLRISPPDRSEILRQRFCPSE